MLSEVTSGQSSPHQTIDDRRAARAAYMREYGRARGAIPVKGVVVTCALCGTETEKRHRAHDWCADCTKEGQRRAKNERRRRSGTEPVGTEKACKNCSASFIKAHKRQDYCPPCMRLAASEALPAYRHRINGYQSTRNKHRRRSEPAYAISCRMSAGINGSLLSRKGGRKWETLVGYTLSDLMNHLERQFIPGMTWDNRGEWHIDHIRPLCSFEFKTSDDPHFREAWALSNLRPLWALDNIRKGGRWTPPA